MKSKRARCGYNDHIDMNIRVDINHIQCLACNHKFYTEITDAEEAKLWGTKKKKKLTDLMPEAPEEVIETRHDGAFHELQSQAVTQILRPSVLSEVTEYLSNQPSVLNS